MERETLLPIDKSFTKIVEQIERDLAATPISMDAPGGIARLILMKVGEQLSAFYKTFTLQHAQVFISKATGTFLDRIGSLLNCKRQTGETDDNYRYRIGYQTLNLERANETAIRLAALSVAGVKDVVLKEYSHGTGSFSVYPVMDDPLYWNPATVNAIQSAVNKVKAYGTKAVILRPRLVEVQIRAKLVFDESLATIERTVIIANARQAVRDYINTLLPGAKLEIKKLISDVIHSSEHLIDMEVYYFYVDGKQALVIDQSCAWNERFIEAQTPNAVLIS